MSTEIFGTMITLKHRCLNVQLAFTMQIKWISDNEREH